MKENESKKKRKYDWCASKEKNTNATQKFVGKPEYDGVSHHTRPQHFVNSVRYDSGLPRR